jgi:hypothetical protein
MKWLLAGGILLRFLVLITAGAENSDPHLLVIQYIADTGTLPVSNLLNQSYHPPLYYVLMAPLWRAAPMPGPIHFASFVFSTLNLILIRRLMDRPDVYPTGAGKLFAFAVACFLPEFVMFGLFVSNDTLTMLTGTILMLCVLRYIEQPTLGRLSVLGVGVGIGLLTKGTFLLTGIALLPVMLIVESRKPHWARRIVTAVAVFCSIWLALGCFKYVDNAIRLGRPIVHNLDVPNQTYRMQRGTWKGLKTIFDFNIVKLVREPILLPRSPSSYPLLMYATFWYTHIPNSSYFGSWHGYGWVGSVIYAMATVPTIVFFAGGFRAIRTVFTAGEWTNRRLIVLASLLLLLSNLLVVLAAGVKYEVWSCFQSRLCFQSMVPMVVLFGMGYELLERLPRWARAAIAVICWMLVACFVLYFAIEIVLHCGLLPVGEEVQQW